VNEELEDTPELVNQKPYEAFIYALELSKKSELEDLLSYSEYQKFLEDAE